MIDYSKLTVPRLVIKQIAQHASDFRKKYWPNKPSPIDIMSIIEFDLLIQIIPIPDLQRSSGVTCFITSDWKTILIDKDQFDNEGYDKRTNFSLAHELAHFVLHKNLYEALGVHSIEEFYNFFQHFPEAEYRILEKQAHSFAARVLVPREELIQEIKNMYTKFGEMPDDADIRLQKRFVVSGDVILKRIQNEKIQLDPEIIEML